MAIKIPDQGLFNSSLDTQITTLEPNDHIYRHLLADETKIYIPDDTSLHNNKYSICFRFFLESTSDNNICNRDGDFWFGVDQGKLTFIYWDEGGTRYDEWSEDVSPYLHKWFNVELYREVTGYNGNWKFQWSVRINDISNTLSEQDLGSSPPTGNYKFGIIGKIKDIILSDIERDFPTYREGELKIDNHTLGVWTVTNNDLQAQMGEPISMAYSGIYPQWDNDISTNAILSGTVEYTPMKDYGLTRECIILNSLPELGEIYLGYKKNDPNDKTNYIPIPSRISDTTNGTEFEFNFKPHKNVTNTLRYRGELSAVELDGVTPKTISGSYTWLESSVSEVAILKVTDTTITLSENVRGNPKISGLDGDYSVSIYKNTVIIKHSKAGLYDITISNLEDDGHNPIQTLKTRMVFDLNIETFTYNGQQYEVKESPVDTYENKIYRKLRGSLNVN